jgi:hypothetical protein
MYGFLSGNTGENLWKHDLSPQNFGWEFVNVEVEAFLLLRYVAQLQYTENWMRRIYNNNLYIFKNCHGHLWFYYSVVWDSCNFIIKLVNSNNQLNSKTKFAASSNMEGVSFSVLTHPVVFKSLVVNALIQLIQSRLFSKLKTKSFELQKLGRFHFLFTDHFQPRKSKTVAVDTRITIICKENEHGNN